MKGTDSNFWDMVDVVVSYSYSLVEVLIRKYTLRTV